MTTTMTRSHDEASRRVEKLSHASLRKIIDPDVDLPGEVGPGQVLPDELLSIHELPDFAGLTREQRAKLSREETASVIDAGLRFEPVLMAGFAHTIVAAPDPTDARGVDARADVGPRRLRHRRRPAVRDRGPRQPRLVRRRSPPPGGSADRQGADRWRRVAGRSPPATLARPRRCRPGGPVVILLLPPGSPVRH